MSQSVDIHALAGAYALDAVTDVERAGFARHLAECETCATEVAELAETAARLSLVTRATPPPRLRDAVLAEVGRTRQLSADRRRHAAERTSRRASGRAGWSSRLLGAVAAALVLIVGIGAVWVQQQRLGEAQRQYAALQEAQERTSRILAAGDAELHSVSVGGGTVTVAVSDRLGDGVVLVENLPDPPEGRVYQVWRIADGAATSIGVFDEGQRSGAVPMGTLGGADTIGVTREPPGGSATPTLDEMVATVTIA